MSGDRSKRPLHHWILIALVAGAIAGVAANRFGARSAGAKDAIALVADSVAYPIGQVFLRLLFLVVVPLVFASLATGVANLGHLRELGRIGARPMAFFFLTTAFSAALGILLIGVVRPGVGFDEPTRQTLMQAFGGEAAKVQAAAPTGGAHGALAIANLVLDAFLPRNILDAVVKMQMLPLITLALLFGAALTALSKDRREPMVRWLEIVAEGMVGIVGFAMRLAPFAVFCLIFSVVSKFGLDLLG